MSPVAPERRRHHAQGTRTALRVRNVEAVAGATFPRRPGDEMTVWARWAAVVVVSAMATTLGGCESPLGPPATSGDVLAGRWTACLNDGAGDFRKSMTFYPDASYLLVTQTYATADRTCGGAETAAAKYEVWTCALGQEVPAYIGAAGTPVTAREMNSMSSRATIYSIVYQDAHATPPLLYFGDLKLDPALDGTAPTKRPDVLATSALTGF